MLCAEIHRFATFPELEAIATEVVNCARSLALDDERDAKVMLLLIARVLHRQQANSQSGAEPLDVAAIRDLAWRSAKDLDEFPDMAILASGA